MQHPQTQEDKRQAHRLFLQANRLICQVSILYVEQKYPFVILIWWNGAHLPMSNIIHVVLETY